MKICLFFPPDISGSENKEQVNPPIGMLYIASSLMKEGHTVKFYDCVLEKIGKEQFKDILINENPNYVGIGFVSTLRKSGFLFSKIAKETLPNSKVVVGGVHCSIFPKKILEEYPFIDYVIYNEGELTFNKLIKNGPQNTPGVCYRDGNEIIKNKARPPVENLDELPMPMWNLCCMESYFKNTKKFGADYIRYPQFGIITSRGCPNKCTFCGSQKLSINVRRHSPQYVYDMIKELNQKYGVKDIYFLDDTFALSIDWLNQFKELLNKNPLDAVYSGQIRANTSNEVLKILKELGFYSINIGVESGSQKVLNAMRKGIAIQQIRNCVKTAHNLGLLVKIYLIFGELSETKEDIRETVRLVNSLPIDEFVWGRMTFFPGTQLCTMRGIPDDWWFKNDFMPLSENFNSSIVNFAWFLMSVNKFFKQVRYKSKLNHKSWIKTAFKQLTIIGGLGIFINKIQFKTELKRDIWAYIFLPLGSILTFTGINRFILRTFLKAKYGRNESIYFDDKKNVIGNFVSN